MAHWTLGAASWPPQDQHYFVFEADDDEESAHGSSISPTPRQVVHIGPSHMPELHQIGEGVAPKCLSGASDADEPPPGQEWRTAGASIMPAAEAANSMSSWFAMSAAMPAGGDLSKLSPRTPPPPSSAQEAGSAASAATAAAAGLLYPPSSAPSGFVPAAGSSPSPTPQGSRVGFAEGTDNGGVTLVGPAAAELLANADATANLDEPLSALAMLEVAKRRDDAAGSDAVGKESREDSFADGASSSAAGPHDGLSAAHKRAPSSGQTSNAAPTSRGPSKSSRPKAKSGQRRRSTTPPRSQTRGASAPTSAAGGPGKERQRHEDDGQSAPCTPRTTEIHEGAADPGVATTATSQTDDGSVMEERLPGDAHGGLMDADSGTQEPNPDLGEGDAAGEHWATAGMDGESGTATSGDRHEVSVPWNDQLGAHGAEAGDWAQGNPFLRDGLRTTTSSAGEARELHAVGPEGSGTTRPSAASASSADTGSPRQRRTSNADRFGLSPDRQSNSSGASSRRISNRASDYGSRIEDVVFKGIKAYTLKFPASCPTFCVLVSLVVVSAIVGLGFRARSVQVESEFEESLQTNVEAEAAGIAFQSALSARTRRLQTEVTVYASVFDLQVAYELHANSGYDSIFDFDALVAIRQFENWLRSMPAWRRLCEQTRETDRVLCDPGVSFASYALPTQQRAFADSASIIPDNLTLNGLGKDILPIQTAFSSIEHHNLTGLFLQSGFTSLTYDDSFAVRSVFRFRIICCDETLPEKERRRIAGEQKAEWQNFVREALLPALQYPREGLRQPDTDALWPIHVYFDGTDMQTLEVTESLMKDLKLAGGSILLVTAYLVYYTHSLVLSAVGVFFVVAAWPVAFVFFTVFADTAKLSIAAFLSVFLAAGFGADMIILYTDAWRSTDRGQPLVREVAEARMVEAYQQGVKASFPTTLATAMYFMANIFAALRPMRDFGLLMGLCVIVAWCLITLVYFPVCLLEEQHCKGMRVRGKPRRSASHENRLSTLWVSHLRTRRRWYFFLLLAIMGGIWLIGDMADNSDAVSGAFPLHHNQNRGKEVLKTFSAPGDTMPKLEPAPPPTVQVCNEQDFDADVTNAGDAGCAFFWCEVDSSVSTDEGANDEICHCFRSDLTGCAADAPVANTTQRLIGRSSLAENQLEALREHFLAPSQGESSSGLNFSDGNATPQAFRTATLPPMLLQEWETGGSTFVSSLQLEATLLRLNSNASCGWRELCFCGTPVCLLHNRWDEFGPVNLGQASGAIMLPLDQAALVSMVFGITLEYSGTSWFGEAGAMRASWEFNPSFDPTVPDVQRSLRSWCLDPPGDLQIQESDCWIEDFRTYVVRVRGDRFPTLQRDFNPFLQDYLREGASEYTTELPPADYLWLSPTGDLQAFYYKFALSAHKDASVEVARDLLQRWDNAMFFESWHTSELWIKATEPISLKRGMIVAGSIMGFFVFSGTMICTCNCALPLLVVFSSVGIIVVVTLVVFVAIGWAMGPIEVITIITLTGYAVSYSARVAIKYGGSEFLQDYSMPGYESLDRTAELRLQRTFFAVRTSGEPSVHSALTMVGSSVFLVFCTITVFQKLGLVMIAMALTSVIVALSVLPAALLSVGPAEPRRSCCLQGDDAGECVRDVGKCFTSAVDTLVAAEHYASSSMESFGRSVSTTKTSSSKRHQKATLSPKSEAIGATAAGIADSSTGAILDATTERAYYSPAPLSATEVPFAAAADAVAGDLEAGEGPSLMSERRDGDAEVPNSDGGDESGGVPPENTEIEQPEPSVSAQPGSGWDAFSRGNERAAIDPRGPYVEERRSSDGGYLMHDHELEIGLQRPPPTSDPSSWPGYQRPADELGQRRKPAVSSVSATSDFDIGNESALQQIQVNAVMPMRRMGRSRSPSSTSGSRSNSRQMGSISDLGAPLNTTTPSLGSGAGSAVGDPSLRPPLRPRRQP